MQNRLMDVVEKSTMKTTTPPFEIGDTVDVHVRILEGDKERIQIFNGVVIGRSGSGSREMFIVRRIVQGEGVERKFPLHSPRIADIVVKRSGKVRRAKLYYLRQRSGKAVRLKAQLAEAGATPEQLDIVQSLIDGIHQLEVPVARLHQRGHSVARDARGRVHDANAATGQIVEQRRLPDVRPADERDVRHIVARNPVSARCTRDEPGCKQLHVNDE